MVQIQKIEEGSDEVYEFIDDKVLRKEQDAVVKEEVEEEWSIETAIYPTQLYTTGMGPALPLEVPVTQARSIEHIVPLIQG